MPSGVNRKIPERGHCLEVEVGGRFWSPDQHALTSIETDVASIQVDPDTGLSSIQVRTARGTQEVRDLLPQDLMDLATALQTLSRVAGPIRSTWERSNPRPGSRTARELESRKAGQSITDSRGRTRPL
jgi:hypothetical protein